METINLQEKNEIIVANDVYTMRAWDFKQDRENVSKLLDIVFEKELESMRYCRAVFDSEGYEIGYEWAKKQDKDYLMQHFGLYFNEWNEKGLGRISKDRFNELYDQSDIPLVLASMPQARKQTDAGSGKVNISGMFTSDESIIAGIMEAIKELAHESVGA